MAVDIVCNDLTTCLTQIETATWFLTLLPLILFGAGFIYGAKKDLASAYLTGGLLGLVSSLLFSPIYAASGHTFFGLAPNELYGVITLLSLAVYFFLANVVYKTNRPMFSLLLTITIASNIYAGTAIIYTDYLPTVGNNTISFGLAEINGSANCSLYNGAVWRDGAKNLTNGNYIFFDNNTRFGSNNYSISCVDNSGPFSVSKEIKAFDAPEQMWIIYLGSLIAALLSIPMLIYLNIIKFKNIISMGVLSLLLSTITLFGLTPENIYYAKYYILYFIAIALYMINIIVSLPLLLTTFYEQRMLKHEER